MVAHDEPYGYIEALEAVIPDIKDKREINGIVNRFERYTELLFVSPGDEKDNMQCSGLRFYDDSSIFHRCVGDK